MRTYKRFRIRSSALLASGVTPVQTVPLRPRVFPLPGTVYLSICSPKTTVPN